MGYWMSAEPVYLKDTTGSQNLAKALAISYIFTSPNDWLCPLTYPSFPYIWPISQCIPAENSQTGPPASPMSAAGPAQPQESH